MTVVPLMYNASVCLIFFCLVPTITPNVSVIPTISGQQQISIDININVSTNNTSDAVNYMHDYWKAII